MEEKDKDILLSKTFIDGFMNRYYQKIHNRYKRFDGKINSRGISPLDILNDTVINIYTKGEYSFNTQYEADCYFCGMFNLKKPNKKRYEAQ